MLGVRKWFDGGADRSATAQEATLHAALSDGIARCTRASPEVLRGLTGSVTFDDRRGPVTLHAANGALSAQHGKSRTADTTVLGDTLMLSGVMRGSRGATDAFLRGRLRVRGNLALALKLDALFERRLRPSDRPRARRADAAGIDTFYLDAGSGPPVVLLHGLGATNASMLPTLTALAAHHRVLAPDLPGSGDTAKPSGTYDARFLGEWLLAFLDAVGLESAHLVGNSMGGRVALEVGLVAPHRVGKLVLLAPSLAFRKYRQAAPLVRLLPPEMGRIPLPMLRLYARHSVESLFARPERLRPDWHDSATDEFMRVFSDPQGRVALLACAQQIYLETPFGPDGFWSRLPALAPPALFVWGDSDRLVPCGFARHVCQALPRARSVILPECGHIPQFEHPAITNELALTFLREDAASSSEATEPAFA